MRLDKGKDNTSLGEYNVLGFFVSCFCLFLLEYLEIFWGRTNI